MPWGLVWKTFQRNKCKAHYNRAMGNNEDKKHLMHVLAREKISETLRLLMLFHAILEERCCLVKYWKRGMHKKIESLYSHDKRLHPHGWSMANFPLLKLVIDEPHRSKVKLQPTFPGCHTVIPAKRLPCPGCLAHGKSGVWPLKTGCQASCIVAAQRRRAGHTDKKDRDKQKRVEEERHLHTRLTGSFAT